MKVIRRCLLVALIPLLFASGALADVNLEAAIEKATTPQERIRDGAKEGRRTSWDLRHEDKVKRAQQGGWELVFIGDSITHGWEYAPHQALWERYYAPRKALNLGYSGDRTENVLWRLDHGEIDGYRPKVAIIMIGTNNTGHRNDPPAAIAAGIQAIIGRLQKQSPTTKILLLGIFPRSAQATDQMRVNNDQANELIAKFADGEKVTFLNINDKFLAADGTLSKEVMPDLLHPQAEGYRIWAEAMEPTLKRLLDAP